MQGWQRKAGQWAEPHLSDKRCKPCKLASACLGHAEGGVRLRRHCWGLLMGFWNCL